MSDADVDGSHIRTLLLTFFYRQFPQLIEQGHLYISQPPLYKLKKGKKEYYILDELEYIKKIFELSLSKYKFKNKPELDLVSFAPEVMGLRARLRSKNKNAKQAFISRLLFDYEQEVSELNQASLQRFFDEAVLKNPFIGDFSYKYDQKNEYFEITLNSTTYYLDLAELAVFEYEAYQASLAELKSKLAGLKSEAGYELLSDDQSNPKAYSYLAELLDDLQREGKKTIKIQRYKGLGEMNADQLWDTTMDPSKRKFIQIKIEDADQASQMVELLMGKKVKPRQEFIMKNALEIQEIDYV